MSTVNSPPKTPLLTNDVIIDSTTAHSTSTDVPFAKLPLRTTSCLRVFADLSEEELRDPSVPLSPMCASLEYLTYVTLLTVIGIHGFVCLSEESKIFEPQFYAILHRPLSFYANYLGSVGSDTYIDHQWRAFTGFLPHFALMAGVQAVAVSLVRRWARRGTNNPSRSSASPRDGVSVAVSAIFSATGTIFLAVLHGPHFVFPVFFILVNYLLFTQLQRLRSCGVYMGLMWTCHIVLLYLIEVYQGFEECYYVSYYIPSSRLTSMKVTGLDSKPLWTKQIRWYVTFRVCTLRMIAFNYDLWCAHHDGGTERQRVLQKHMHSCVDCAVLRKRLDGLQPQLPFSLETTSNEESEVVISQEKNYECTGQPLPVQATNEVFHCYMHRTEYPRDLSDYSFLHCMAYMLFMPVYLAGPISSFNAFVSHLHVPMVAVTSQDMCLYMLRIACLYVTFLTMVHFVFFNAFSENTAVLRLLSLPRQAYMMFFYLGYIWLKFNFIYKCSRLFALWNGVEVPEDMPRFFLNSFSVRHFWRDWHVSFNLWVVRYMYIPMGGNRRPLLTIAPIFLFVAIWHDLALHLVKWALCVVVMFIIEHAVVKAFVKAENSFSLVLAKDTICNGKGIWATTLRIVRHWTPLQRRRARRLIVGIGSVGALIALSVANVIGYNFQKPTVVGEGHMHSESDRTIIGVLREFPWSCYVLTVVFFFCAGSAAIIQRQWEAARLHRLRHKLGLVGG